MPVTPMFQQYLDIKEQYKDCILFYRVGDFYEMFNEDALVASKAMEITLTGKACGLEERAPMCGVPYHAVDTYVAKLIAKGFKVAICEQVEDPALAKGLVKREVIRIVTPGTVTAQTMLSESENNYLASIYEDEEGAGLVFCDISTGEMAATSFRGADAAERLSNELVKIRPRELLVDSDDPAFAEGSDVLAFVDVLVTPLDGAHYTGKAANERILSHFRTGSLRGIGLEEEPEIVCALAALLAYLFETQKQDLSHLSRLNVYTTRDHMSLDKYTIRNLELTETLFEKKPQGALLGVLDRTHTAMGSRKMKQWLREPLNRLPAIKARLDAVETLTDDVLLRNDLAEALKGIYDLERLTGRVSCGNANARDMIALRNSIAWLPEIKAGLAEIGDPLLEELAADISEMRELHDSIERAIVEDPPFLIREGGLIKPGYSKELDDLKASIADGQQWIANLESVERERTGIKNLRVSYNKVFGYYIEVSNSFRDKVPENYIRKQTLVNGERFITPEMKEVESIVLNAETKINQLEYNLFQALRAEVETYIPQIQKTSQAVSSIDVLRAFAEAGEKHGYVKPAVTDGDVIRIEKGRHPVIETMAGEGTFVSNDTYMDRAKQSLLLITGPNMSGKSTYMRQTALIVLMAQAGCFVPADAAEIGIVDRIYTRIGASDNLAQGQSTFFVEMSELAYILNTCTEKSLVILDEIGRGTSTYDGLSIAYAAAEYLCREKNQVRTLFATHYHELTTLESELPGLKNLNVDVRESNGNIVFLHKIVEGSASRSYGIHVAKLAGVPPRVLETAETKLGELEGASKAENRPVDERKPFAGEMDRPEEKDAQISFFDFAPNPVVERLRSLDLMEITPSKAFEILQDLQDAAKRS